MKIDVLDHGFVRLVDHMGGDLSVVRAARVSYDAAWRSGSDQGSDERLIRYLWNNRHTSPFEAVEFQFEVYAPIFVFRQWHRHRTWAFNELSGRYRELPEVFYVPDAHIVGEQSAMNKQGRQDTGITESQRMGELSQLAGQCNASFDTYRDLLEAKWPRELARSVLPVNTYSHMFAKVNLRNLLHFLDLRCDPHAQYEIRVYAEAMREIAREVAPVCLAVWEEQRHPDNLAVDRFAAAMKEKLAQKRAEGRGGWDNPDECSIEALSRMLIEHLGKGDPVDIGNFAMMIHQRGGTVSS